MIHSLQDDMISEARGYFINGNYKMAEPILNQMLLQNTRNPEVYQMLATIAYDKGQFSKAIKTFKRALEIDPTYTDASVGLSIILNDLGKYDEGKQVFLDAQSQLDKKSGKQDPFVDEKLASKHEELADLYYQYKRYNEALEQLLKAQKLSSRKAEITLRVAEVNVQLNQTERAIKDLKSLIREYPHLIPARLKLGAIYYNSNNIAEATEQWENILIRDPQHPEALRYLKMAQAAGITSIDL
ncbi:tetratricopeptide repeat protein [Bdellovibrio sp. GT3]|uniref:tetratricopeptide repeat protein n=1 Tax=unclassified Bdellovibrio TaxID=2633795 RepID=UPI0030F19E7E